MTKTVVTGLILYVYVKSDCELNCRFCYARERRRDGPSLSASELRVLAEQASLQGVTAIILTGGD